jgi:hypothetical protein
MHQLFKDKEHLLRVAGIFLAGVVIFLVARAFLVPKDFGLYGHFRAGALDDIRAQPIAFAGRPTCETCHSEVPEVLNAGKHAKIHCEACHGPLAKHAESGEPKPERPNGRTVCLVCHTANTAKPQGFPQIDPKDHMGDGLCTECHLAHNPGRAPEVKK